MADTKISALTTLAQADIDSSADLLPIVDNSATETKKATPAALIAAAIDDATGKTTPVDADTVPLTDSSASNVMKKVTWSNIKATLKTYFDTLYAATVHTHAISDVTSLQTTLDGKQDEAVVVSTNQTAVNDGVYVVVASATFTDPSPTEGKGYTVFVRNGTATIGGTGYSTAGSLIYRVFHSGAWANYNIGIQDLSSYLTASSTATLTNKSFNANGTGNSLTNVEVADFASGVIDTDLTSVSANDNTLPSAKATKTALDLKVDKSSVPVSFQIACSDLTTALTTGTSKAYFRAPYAFTVTAVRASLLTAQASGNIFTVDINENGSSILSVKLTIDNTEKTSTTAATAAVISDSSIANDAEITIDIDQIGASGAAGLIVTIIGTRSI